jgi:hypothetical protein
MMWTDRAHCTNATYWLPIGAQAWAKVARVTKKEERPASVGLFLFAYDDTSHIRAVPRAQLA